MVLPTVGNFAYTPHGKIAMVLPPSIAAYTLHRDTHGLTHSIQEGGAITCSLIHSMGSGRVKWAVPLHQKEDKCSGKTRTG